LAAATSGILSVNTAATANAVSLFFIRSPFFFWLFSEAPRFDYIKEAGICSATFVPEARLEGDFGAGERLHKVLSHALICALDAEASFFVFFCGREMKKLYDTI
jgi:hypothetical protein